MKSRFPNLVWIGLALAAAYWLIESVIHTVIFHGGPLSETISGEHDTNEVWMRLIISGMFVAFGWIAERTVKAERHLREDAQRINRLLRFVDRLTQGLDTKSTAAAPAPTMTPSEPVPVAPEAMATRWIDGPAQVSNSTEGKDDIATLARLLQELSSHLDLRVKELYALLQLNHEINMGLLLDEVLEKAYGTLCSVIPYSRLSVALLEEDGQMLRARWVKSDHQTVVLQQGYTGMLKESSLTLLLISGEPRIINDLAAYFETHPHSDSTRLLVAEGIRSSLTCPLIATGKPIGFIFFASRIADVYRNAHVEVFKLIAGHFSVVVEKSNLYQEVLREKAKSEALLLNVMPARIVARLRRGEATIAETLTDTSVLFADIVQFTDFASRYEPAVVVQLLKQLFVSFDGLCDRFGIEKIKTIGDAYLAIGGRSGASVDGHERNIALFGLAMLRVAQEVRYPDGQPVRVRIGIHTGSVVAGVIGQKQFAYDFWGTPSMSPAAW